MYTTINKQNGIIVLVGKLSRRTRFHYEITKRILMLFLFPKSNVKKCCNLCSKRWRNDHTVTFNTHDEWTTIPLQLKPLPALPETSVFVERYHISVYTGWRTQGRFTGDVFLQLFCSERESSPFKLQDGERLVSNLLTRSVSFIRAVKSNVPMLSIVSCLFCSNTLINRGNVCLMVSEESSGEWF